ncbi:hypothetical protein MMAD_27120 [Mycolicibacterium madagascariense]|uniref:Phosphatidylglycerol--prolipoprotein diacylglyceryl transferase n=1 Tax=Mycolicibacterium madagascariense TaxID=212765 RepID=A0A7I7XGT4_9MYCO|nr:prolipoprotein diacylglyceryl transferase [Mycolicibacterium madagascariense]MCV7012254.1 prolipoprotein diacylglyceryl transferase [Mycolicibacterium madagascariense]BBZ28417.1 hypothetical protein MMAD_27120 [Mycolicibacterium madagascariense]
MTTTVLAYIPSPSQGVWHLGPVPIRAYALCIIVGIVAALVIGDRRWEARGGERGVIYDVALWAVPFGLIGGRLYHLMTDWQKYFGADGAGFLAALRIWDGGLGIWGAVALGGVGAWIACRRRGIPLPAFGDAIAPGIILAQAIGRLGNYFNQELYGRATDLPWGLTIYDRLDPTGVVSPHSLDGVSTGQVYAVVHPTFLYELLWNLLIFALLLWADRRFQLGHGRLFALYVAGYCVGRFWVELMRSDTATLIAGIRVNSFTSTFVFIGAVIYVMAATKGREAPESLRGKPTDESLVDEIGEGLVAVAATSGVVAAAKVAGDEDRAASTTSTGSGGSTEPATDSGDHDTHSEAAAENEDLIDQVENAPSEDIAEAEAFAAAGDAADEEHAEPEEREAGMGAVEGDAAAEAEDRAPDAHEAAVAGAAVAEGLADQVADEPDEADTEPEDETEPEEREAGMGAVEGDAAAEAEDRAPDAHEAAIEGAAEAEDLADKVAAEPDEAETKSEDETEPEEREAGMGTVEGDAATEAEDRAPDAHEAAVAGAAEAEELKDQVDSEPDEPTSDEPEEREAGMGAVEGDAAAEAEDRAPDAHEAAIEGAAEAEELKDQVAAEPDEDETKSEDEPEEREAGMGAVEGDAAAEAEDRAPDAHEAAVAGAADAEELKDQVADEPNEDAREPDEPKSEAAAENVDLIDQVKNAPSEYIAEAEEFAAAGDSATDEPKATADSAADEAGMGSVEGDAATEAEDRAPEAHESAVEGAAAAEDLADEVNAQPSTTTPTPSASTSTFTPSRRRWWQRR